MLNHRNQKLFIVLVGITFLVIGISVGNILSANLKLIDLEAINYRANINKHYPDIDFGRLDS